MRGWSGRLTLLVYNLLLVLLAPLLLPYFLWRLWRGKEDRAHWRERWGRLPARVGEAGNGRRPRIWVHAVSVGEVMAGAPVLRELRRRVPDAFLVLSTTTTGGREVALRQAPPADEVIYFPLDFPLAAFAALARVRPNVVVLMEWEIWPNFLALAKRRGAKIAVLNGRISDKGLARAQKAGGGPLLRAVLPLVDRFAMQSAEDARRATLVGAPPERVAALGNTKFDEAVQPLSDGERAALRADLGIAPHAPVWVCGSTRPGEEAIIAGAYLRARQTFPNLCLIVAPRHIERAGEVAGVFARAGLETVRRSQKAGTGAAVPVLLLDTFGELGRVYAVADAAFVGGSLLPFGGQSVFQPLAQGVPALFGPHMNNQRDIAALSRAAGVGFKVTDSNDLVSQVMHLLSLSAGEKQRLRETALALIARNQGVAARCADLVAGLLAAEAAAGDEKRQ